MRARSWVSGAEHWKQHMRPAAPTDSNPRSGRFPRTSSGMILVLPVADHAADGAQNDDTHAPLAKPIF